MKPTKSILDESFAYTPAAATAVDATWRRYGWQPVTEQERKNRRHPATTQADARVVELKTLRSA
jgi:hypothetical protein